MATNPAPDDISVDQDYASGESRERAAERRALTIVNRVPALIAYWNRELRCEFANERHRDLFGLQPEQIVGLRLQELMGERASPKLDPHVSAVLQGHAQRFERSHRSPDGSILRLEEHYIPDVQPGGVVRGFFVHSVDVTAVRAVQHALQAENSRLAADSATDFLTGLANRRAFSERSETAWKNYQATGEVCALILVDLDDFKRINDAHGHGAGDDVLRAVGVLLRNQLRSQGDMAARLGGEEFAVLCFGNMNEELAMQIAERLRGQFGRQSIVAGGFVFDFTASFGLAVSDSRDSCWKDLYTRADAALYEAKAAGKNQVKFLAPVTMTPSRG